MPRESEGLDVPVLVRMTPDLAAAVRETAVREDRSMASVVRQAIREHLARTDSDLDETGRIRDDLTVL